MFLEDVVDTKHEEEEKRKEERRKEKYLLDLLEEEVGMEVVKTKEVKTRTATTAFEMCEEILWFKHKEVFIPERRHVSIGKLDQVSLEEDMAVVLREEDIFRCGKVCIITRSILFETETLCRGNFLGIACVNKEEEGGRLTRALLSNRVVPSLLIRSYRLGRRRMEGVDCENVILRRDDYCVLQKHDGAWYCTKITDKDMKRCNLSLTPECGGGNRTPPSPS